MSIGLIMMIGFVVVLILTMVAVVFIKASQYAKALKGDGFGAVMTILRMANGTDRRQLESLGVDGRTVKILGGWYILDELTTEADDADKKRAIEEIRETIGEKNIIKGAASKHHYTLYPTSPIFGIKALQRQVREEIWEQDNPNPCQAPPGRPFLTAGENAAQLSGAEAYIEAKDIKEREERNKRMEKVLLNLPSKGIIYIGLGAIAVGLVYLVIQFMAVASNVSSISVAFGLGG